MEDVTAWCVLALIVSYAQSPPTPNADGSSTSAPPVSSWNSIIIFAVLVVFITLLMGVLRPLLDRVYKRKLEMGQDLNTTFVRQCTHRTTSESEF